MDRKKTPRGGTHEKCPGSPPVSLNGTDYSRVRDLLEKKPSRSRTEKRRVGELDFFQETLHRQATVEHATVGGYRASIAARVAN